MADDGEDVHSDPVCTVDRGVQEFDPEKIQKKFSTSFVSGKLEHALYDYWSVYVPRVFSSRLTVDSASEERKLRRFLLKPLETFLCNGDPETVFSQLKEYDKPSHLCGKVFRYGEPTYSCRDCGADPTCVLCVECFQQSIHRQHKYKMSTSGGGGYCDCGDSEAWKTGAFCSIHEKGLEHQSEQLSPADSLPADFRQRASAVFHIVVTYAFKLLRWTDGFKLPNSLHSPLTSERGFVTMLFNDETHTYEQVISTLTKAVGCSHKTAIDFATAVDREGRTIVKEGRFNECESARKVIEKQTSRGQGSKPLKVFVMDMCVVAHQTFALKLLTWLQQVISYSGGLRSMFTALSLAPISDTELMSLVETVMLADTQLWKAVRVSSHQLFMSGILMDAEAKKQFGILFTKIYTKMMDQFVQDDHDHSVSAVSESVQIFTVPTLARLLVAEHNLLQVILDCFLTQCTPRLNKDGKLVFERQDRTSSFLRAQYMLHDLKYALTCRPQSADEWTPELRAGFLNGFNSLLRLLKLMQGMDGVVRQMSTHVEFEPEWEGAFNLQLKLSDILTIIQDWCSTDDSVASEAYWRTVKALDSDLVHKAQLDQCTVVVAEHSTVCMVYDFTCRPVSVHLPLTRLLAGLYVLLQNTPECLNVDELMLPSIHTLVLVAQCQAGMWRRNGFSLQNQVYFYHSVKCRGEMFNKDIIMIQIGASLMDSNQFLIYLLYKFGLTNWIKSEYDTEVSQEDSVKQIITLAEHFFLLVISCICERYQPLIGQVDSSSVGLRRAIIHLLCLQSMSHSELVKNLPEDPYRETTIEDIVHEVAVFRKPTGSTGKGLYELKQACYSEYHPYYYHYTRTDQAKAEEAVRKRRESGPLGAALIPPSMPKFVARFHSLIRLLDCDVMIAIVQLVLTRTTARWSKSWSETQFEMVLYLVALAIHQEKESILEGDDSFNFVSKARQGVFKLLECLSNHVNVRHQGQKDMINYIVKTASEVGTLRNTGSDFPMPTIQRQATSSIESKLEKEKRKKAEMAAKRRERIMAQMARAQRNFIRENRELFETANNDTFSGSMDDSSQSDFVVDGTITSERPVALGSRRTIIAPSSNQQICILCQEEQEVSHTEGTFVLCAYVQRSTVLSRCRGRPLTDIDPLFMRHDLPLGTHVSACGHVMHADCWRRFFDALLAKEARRSMRFRSAHTSYDLRKNEFLCPLCETISNTVLPLMPSLHVLSKDSAGMVDPELSLSDWLDGIQKTVAHSIQQHRDKESQEESFLFVPCPLSSVTKMMTESVARNFQLLFDYVCDDDASAHFSDSMTEVLRKFCTDVYSTGLGVLPDDGNVNVPVTVWRACAYTIMSLEHCLRDEDKPLFGSLASRQADCVSALVRLAAVSGHISTPAVVKQHCVTLLAALVCEGNDYRLRHEPGRQCILDIDMFHYLVALCLSLPALYAEDEAVGANKQIHVATGRLNDLHVLHLVLVAHVVQIFLTASISTKSEDLMETETIADEAEADNVYAIYADIMNRVSLGTMLVSSPTLLLQYTRRACLPFLRAAALFFHYLTNVPPPPELLADASLETQFDILCQYLGLSSSLDALLSQSDVLQHLIPSWCSDPSVKFKLFLNTAQDSSFSVGLPCYPTSVNHLVTLAHDYSELINQLSLFTCPSSDGDDSRVPAMCLVCGSIICSQSYCCQTTKDGQTMGAATSHIKHCGAGTGIFLRVKECQILLLNNGTKGCFLPPPYLDDYGETDQGLKRGNPLHLCPERYQKLQKLWLSHGISEEIVHLLESNTSLMTFEWHHM